VSNYLNAAGQPGSFKLPNPGQPGEAYKALQLQRMHPAAVAAVLGPRANPVNGGRPPLAGGVATPGANAGGGPAK